MCVYVQLGVCLMNKNKFRKSWQTWSYTDLMLMLFLSLTAPSMYDCTFDSPNPCQWSQDHSNDQFDWSIHAGGTSSGFTGPKTDHTLQNTRGKRNTPPIKKNQTNSPLLSSYRLPWLIIAEFYFALIMLSVHNILQKKICLFDRMNSAK